MKTEAQTQAALMQWWAMSHRGFKLPERIFFMIPNGSYFGSGSSSKGVPLAVIRASNAKRQGMRSGVPDLFLAAPRGWYHGFFLELKRDKGGVISKDQLELCGELIDQGYCVNVARGFDDAVRRVTDYLSIP